MARVIDLGHGAGGLRMRELVLETLGPAFAPYVLEHRDDAAVVEAPAGRIAFTTDGFVVRPLFFPGGDIGRLAVAGTVNDLAMVGAAAKWLSVALIIEEGLEAEVLERVAASLGRTAGEAGVIVVTGDTKVVERGSADGIFITTAGIGVVPAGVDISGTRARPGMSVLVSGTMGDHETAIINARESLVESDELRSDCAPLGGLVAELLGAGVRPAVLRDPTRGGLAATLNEIAGESGTGIEVVETAVPVAPAVAGLCGLLGLDPLYLANEGKMVVIVPADQKTRALEVLRGHPLGRDAAVIGEVTADHAGAVALRTRVGGRRALDLPSGRLIPRIC